MKHLKTFENYKSTNEEFDFSMSGAEIDHLLKTLPPLILQFFALKLILDMNRPYKSYKSEEDQGPSFAERFFLKPFKKAVNFFKTAPDKIVASVEDASEEIISLGMEEEAKRWILDNVVYNKELQDGLKSIESNIQTIQGEMSDIDKRRTPGASGTKMHHLDQLSSNKQKMLNYYNKQKMELSNKAKAIVDKLQSDNPALHKALMRSMKDYMDKIYNLEQI
jgi:hypothetical protein